ncbi:unnamed protein product [Protopolystoma xenopodis]|uniref:Uncharacterized protein n=1 Tax=Protopolystoma xenopodis TaxID=117903 RepID=A0A448XCI5_9PLAT|nr:unnamed protein product [Protopolystoma xenopodis]
MRHFSRQADPRHCTITRKGSYIDWNRLSSDFLLEVSPSRRPDMVCRLISFLMQAQKILHEWDQKAGMVLVALVRTGNWVGRYRWRATVAVRIFRHRSASEVIPALSGISHSSFNQP